LSEEKKVVNTNRKKTILIIIIFLSIIMTSIGIFLASYYSSINKAYDSYESTLATNINGINEANTNIAQFNSNQTIDVEYAKEQLPLIIKNLTTLRNGLASVDPSSKYKKDYVNLKSGLDKNLLVYRQTLAILNNPSGNDVETSMANLKTYRNDCMNFYSLVNINNTKIELPKTALTFIENVLNYSSSAVMIRKETNIKLLQSQEFINKIDDLSRSFLNTKTNYYSSALKARNKEISYDALLSEVENNFIKLSAIQTSFKGLSIPPTAIPTYESFKNLLSIQESYLRDFKLALSSEKVQMLSAVVDSSTLDALYTSSNAAFMGVDKSYNNFLKAFTELKSRE
jgi:flagellar basal body-associated protein FliL